MVWKSLWPILITNAIILVQHKIWTHNDYMEEFNLFSVSF